MLTLERAQLRGLLEFFARTGVPIVAMIGRMGSTVARRARVVLDSGVAEEACPYDLAPDPDGHVLGIVHLHDLMRARAL